WDGSGYPDGLRGEQIPLAARILRTVDTWCALTQARPFRPALNPSDALDRLRSLVGTTLDPVVASRWLTRVLGNPEPASKVSPWTVSHSTVHQPPLIGFELAALQTIPFQTIALPFGGDGLLGWHLKLLGKQVFTNDARQAETCLAIGSVENNGYVLTASQLDAWLSRARDAEDNPDFPYNPALGRWFPPAQARWLAGFRRAVIADPNRIIQALGMSLGLYLGDYWLAFDPASTDRRSTLEEVAIEGLSKVNRAVDNQLANQATCLPAQAFAVQTSADVVYVRLPPLAAYHHATNHRDGWRETWVSDLPDALAQLTQKHTGRLGGQLGSRREYRAALRSLLRRLPHIPQWAIGISHDGQGLGLPDDLLTEIIGFRPIAKILTKPVSACGTLLNQSIVFCQTRVD
ncbi:MAG: HD domain-containing phosphohydrolase, partial [Chloracidobacterium sp.]